MKRTSLFFFSYLAAASIICIAAMGRTSAQPFNPIRELTTWYTDRSVIDIEIIGSTSLVRQTHKLEPERTLRFRLERAYIQFFRAQKEPGFELATFGFDMETGLADSLLSAVALSGRFHEDLPGVPHVPQLERMRRSLLISLESDSSMRSLRNLSDSLRQCRGALVGNALWAYERRGRPNCYPPAFPTGSQYVAPFDDELLLQIQCQEQSYSGIGCGLRFPFKGFGVEVRFHRDHLPKWREMIDRAKSFLESKQYR